jgi:hypothetical protein
MAFRSFFAILGGNLPQDVAAHFGYSKAPKRQAEPAKLPEVKTSDGALQILGILQRDARLLDFLMEDIAPYSDDQIGSAVRDIHAQSREALAKYVKLAPVIDGVEGTFTKPESAGAVAREPGAIKFIGNLPAQGKPAGGTLRHKGWRADSISLPSITPKQPVSILAPAELEVE